MFEFGTALVVQVGVTLATGGTDVGSIIDGNRVTRHFPDDVKAWLLAWALVKIEGGMGVGTVN